MPYGLQTIGFITKAMGRCFRAIFEAILFFGFDLGMTTLETSPVFWTKCLIQGKRFFYP